MVHGTLEVLLIGAKGLENTDYLCNMDPYAILKCRSQEQRSSIASGKGSSPEWNENFVFTVSDQATDLVIKLMDSDSGTADDFVGEATIPLEAVYTEGSIPPTAYNVVKGEHYCGEIKVGLSFTREVVFIALSRVVVFFSELERMERQSWVAVPPPAWKPQQFTTAEHTAGPPCPGLLLPRHKLSRRTSNMF
ncbi:hypothetical protein QYE76_023942 [Lolium multiflorum]|uniref:C2 domain-containing protein n=1 Tax=Lolium multiflorum TaxID=4521 RepID=A0AAD8VV90_LOLMU|nr:hypothetical protein QYE76_023942 [Lolium multiflorum]